MSVSTDGSWRRGGGCRGRSVTGCCGYSRETREGWPLLTVETEVSGDSKSTNESGPSLTGSLGLWCLVQEICPALAALVGPVQIIFFLTVHYSNSLGQAAVLGCLSLSIDVSSG
jgi:hypothetical protein